MKKKDIVRNVFAKRSTWAGMLLVFVAAMTLEATSLVQYFYSRQSLAEEASNRAETQLEATRTKIMDVINQAEAAVRNSIWISQWCLERPDSLFRVCQRIVEDNPVITGSTVALVPGSNPGLPLFAPYVCWDADTLAVLSLATESYDYPSQEWFVKPLETGSGYWSEPYVDTGGGEILMTTYSLPIKNYSGEDAAVLTGDISLEWLTALMGDIKIYPNAFGLLISRSGKWIMNRDREFAEDRKLMEVIDKIRDNADFRELERAMRAGEFGHTLISYDKIRRYVYYAPVERTGWSMCIVIPHEDIYGKIQRTGMWVTLLQILGLAMLVLIIRYLIRNQTKYRELIDRKKMMESELHIASQIQMSMVPKVFPPFPERNDLDVAAEIVPAKEIGGDLYDYFLRDNKLFFCIGDVSGKGIPASLVMAVTRSVFRAVASHEDCPGKIVKLMNDSLCDMNENDMFVTYFCGVLDLANGHMTYCNAGHNPPILLTDAIRVVDVKPNLPLGILAGMTFEEESIDLEYDDAMFFYTDGVSEAENIDHEQFGMDRIRDALHGRKKSALHLMNIQQEVEDFVGKAPQSDDMTMLFLHYLGKGHQKEETRQITLVNNIEEISRLEEFVHEIATDEGINVSLETALNLALEEAVTNVVLYAYPEGSVGQVDVSAVTRDGMLTLTLSDSGTPFDPTKAPKADISLDVMERPIGGLGIYLVNNIMDSVVYKYEDGKNILTMTKKIR